MKKFIFAIISLGFIFVSCGKNSGFASKSTTTQLAMHKERIVAEAGDVEEVLIEADFADSGNAADGAAQSAREIEHKLIYTGYISLGVENLSETKSAVEQWLKKYDGYISNSSESQQCVKYTVNVPQ